MAKIRFEKVKKKFGDTTIIKELDLTIQEGEFFTFVGPSGCGKTTILNMIAGLEDISEGKIYFDGVVVNELTPKERDVAMVFQSYALYPHMTVYENIAFPLRMKRKPKAIIDRDVQRIAVILDLEDMLHKKPKELSGGQKQRVALGRAIIRKPMVFLMDEPLSNLDAVLRVEMRGELKRLHQDLKITTIYVTHDQAEALSLSDRLAILNKGEIQQCGIPLEIYIKPANMFVAGFIGSPSMNFIEAVVSKREPFTVTVNNVSFNPLIKGITEVERVVLGIRPDDVAVLSKVEEGTIEAFVELIEVEGAVIWAKLKWGGISLRGKIINDCIVSSGTNVFFKILDDKIHVFDYKTGIRI
ncbi:MAG: ABC transporter ATP-binding protein [Nitrospirota bacterium]